jgi:opacity protein-like surface antigen
LRKILIVVFFLLFLTGSAIAQTSRPPDQDDNQIWHETVVGLPLAKKLTLTVNGVLRFSGDQRRLTDNRAGFGFGYKFNKNVTAGTAYLYRFTETVRNRKNYENRFIAYLTLSKTLAKFGVSDRSQDEYQARNSRRDKWVYRNRLQAEREIKLENFGFKPFVSAEVFYDSAAEKFSRLRLTGGASKKLYKNLTLDAYYMRQQDATTNPGYLNVLGTTLRLNFDFFGISN